MKLYAESILIGNQWKTEQTLSIDEAGFISAIEDGYIQGAEKIQGVVIPGMINSHSHAFQRAFAGFSEYRANNADSFWSWRDIMYRFVAKMSPQDAQIVASFLYLEMLKAGYTHVAEFHYLHHQSNGQAYDNPAEMSLRIIQSAKQTGIGLTHLPVLYTYAGFGEKAPSAAQGRFIHQTEDYCQLVEDLHKQLKDETTMNLGIAPHSLRAVSHFQLQQIIPFIQQLDEKAPIHIHIAEQLKEVEDSIHFYSQRPVAWLLDNFQLDPKWCLIHATHLDDSELKNIIQHNAVVGICPTTEANLGDGIFPAKDFLEQGGKFTIGSDSHIAVNIADELRTLEYGQRLTTHQRAVLTSPDCHSVGQNLYRQAALNGASVTGHNVGEIKIGHRADFVVLDDQDPTLFAKPIEFLLDAALFACDTLPVKDVMVAGKWQIKACYHKDQESIIENYRQVVKKLSS